MVSLKIQKIKMTDKFKILAEFVKDNIGKYLLKIEINSKPLKDKIIEINTTLQFTDNEQNEKKSNFEIVYASIIKIDEEIKDKGDLQKIILCDVQNKIYPNLEKTFLDLLHNSGFPEIKLEKKIDFTELYKQRSN